MDYFRKLHMIFLSLQELGELWRASMFGDVILEMFEKGYSPRDRTKLEIVTDSVSLKRNKQKEDIEIFIAISMCISFFGEDNSKIGFPLIDSFSPKDSKISSLQDLKNVSKENHLTDFAIFYDDKILEFQLKQYKKEITTDKLLTEMIGTIKKYGYTLGTTNIIFNLQGNGPPFNEYELDFGKIHREIKKIINPNTTGHVYIKYNEQNKYSIMIDVYPKLGKHQVPHSLNLLKTMFREI